MREEKMARPQQGGNWTPNFDSVDYAAEKAAMMKLMDGVQTAPMDWDVNLAWGGSFEGTPSVGSGFVATVTISPGPAVPSFQVDVKCVANVFGVPGGTLQVNIPTTSRAVFTLDMLVDAVEDYGKELVEQSMAAANPRMTDFEVTSRLIRGD